MWKALDATGLPFPDCKANAIAIQTHHRGEPDQLIFPVRSGVSDLFKNPDFALHYDVAWDVANVEVEIGGIIPHDSEIVNDFNAMIMDIFNLAKGNILRQGNLLSWNVWFTAPQVVDGEEWRNHAEYWRHSIDTDHGSPDGPGTDPRHFDGSPFDAGENIV
ncbi:hypothetical protein [Aestuariicoccus sp. MJ-SS9]|uniref:hypothetical protein n=1 Tax=Aestuariicoccus sp. MJ-SS9 TaxID=3079855 RepID=UPI0029126F4B|nr:hypothetical protein [Aestuariicoccus sp. MJ-SS9]MDU8913007.1 hypothetical protein [Aestuariicoccus sp. MJ-SS9]